MWDFMLEWISENVALSIALGAALGLVTFASIASAITDSFGVWFGVGGMLGGGALLFALLANVTAREGAVLLAILAIHAGSVYAVAQIITWSVHAKRRKKEGKEARWRQQQFTLPEQENTFVRARLNTVLRMPEESETPVLAGQVEFAYAKNLLEKVFMAELSTTDRLQAQELSALFGVYHGKEKLQTYDMQAINEGFAKLLKLAAKYSVLP